MRLEQLEYFLAVVKHGSLRRAAEALHVSQPAVSEALSKLERELGVSLLERRRSGSSVSAAGRELLDPVSDVLEAVDRLREVAGDRRQRPRTVRIGSVSTGTSSLLTPAVGVLQAVAPQVGVEILDLQQREVFDAVGDASVELGLVNLLPGDELPTGLTGTVLIHGRPVVVMPATHPLAERDSVSVEELRGERFVAMRSGYVMHRFAHRLFGGEPPVVAWAADGSAMGRLLVAEGLGVTILPDYSVFDDPLERGGLVVARPVTGDRTVISLVLVQRQGTRPSTAVRMLVEALVAQAGHRSRMPTADAGSLEPVLQ
jgi:DNA-binding transcriptional LysR family regulator